MENYKTALNICNLKLSTKILTKINEERLRMFLCRTPSFTKRTKNMITLRQDYVFTIFNNGHINITKVKSKSGVRDAVKSILSILHKFDPCIVLDVVHLDNITATTRYCWNKTKLLHIDLYELISLLHKHDNPIIFQSNIRFNPEIFPAAYLTTGRGTCCLFSSGAVNFVGFKTIDMLNKVFYILKEVYYHLIGHQAYLHESFRQVPRV